MKIKGILSLILTLALLLTMTTAVFADEESTSEPSATTGTITISNAKIGVTYKIYRLMDLEYNTTTGAYLYKANSAWNTWLESQEDYLEFTTDGYITWKDGADVKAFSKLAKAYATDANNRIEATASKQAGADGELKFEGVALGYYLVTTNLGTLCALDTTDPNVTITEKNDRPTISKTVEEDSTGDYGSSNDADIGQKINFKTVVKAEKGAENYVVHDKMVSQFTFGSITSITMKAANTSGNTTETPVDASNYTVVTTGLTDDCTFHIEFTQAFLDTLTEDTDITINYTAQLNNTAVANNRYVNETWLTYGEAFETAHVTTTTYTYALEIFKYTKKTVTETVEGSEETTTSDMDVALAGAEFIIQNSNTGKYAIFNASGMFTDWTETKTSATTLTSGTDGYIKVYGLDSDTYSIEEINAPAGYNKLSGTVNVKIDKTDKSTSIENKSGTELPETGGVGTAIFIGVGSMLALAACVFLVTRKKMSIYED